MPIGLASACLALRLNLRFMSIGLAAHMTNRAGWCRSVPCGACVSCNGRAWHAHGGVCHGTRHRAAAHTDGAGMAPEKQQAAPGGRALPHHSRRTVWMISTTWELRPSPGWVHGIVVSTTQDVDMPCSPPYTSILIHHQIHYIIVMMYPSFFLGLA